MIVFVQNLEVFLIQFVDQGFSRRNFYGDDLVRGEVFQHHDNGAERITVGRNENFLSSLDFRGDLLIEIRLHAISGVDEAFRKGAILNRHFSLGNQFFVFFLVAGPTLILFGES